MIRSSSIKSIILYNKTDNYLINLENILDKIRFLDEIKDEVKNKLWDSNIKYRRMWDRSIRDFELDFNLEKGKWTDFIFLSWKFKENNITRINPFTIEELLSSKLRIALLLFWRDISDNLNSDTIFKLQLKLNLTFSTDNLEGDKIFYLSNFENNWIDQIRSIGSVKIYTKNNFDEAFTYFKHSLYLILENYSTFYIKSIILTYNICYDDSILKNSKISDEILKLINKNPTNPTNKSEKINKTMLKINDKNLPVTTDLSKWGNLSIIKGNYPYKFNLKESNVLINVDSNPSYPQQSDSFNFIVSIRGKKYVL